MVVPMYTDLWLCKCIIGKQPERGLDHTRLRRVRRQTKVLANQPFTTQGHFVQQQCTVVSRQ